MRRRVGLYAYSNKFKDLRRAAVMSLSSLCRRPRPIAIVVVVVIVRPSVRHDVYADHIPSASNDTATTTRLRR